MRAGRVGTGRHGQSRPAAALALLPPSPPTPRPSAGVSPPAPRRRLTQLELLAPPAGAPPDPAPENGPGVGHRAVGGPAGPGGARNKPAEQRGRRKGSRPAEPGEGATVLAGTGRPGPAGNSPSLLAVAVQENRVPEEGPVVSLEEQRVLGVQVVGTRRRQALPQQEQRGGPPHSPRRPPAAPHGSGWPKVDGRPAPASRLAPLSRSARGQRRAPAPALPRDGGSPRPPPPLLRAGQAVPGGLPAARGGGVPSGWGSRSAAPPPPAQRQPLSLPRRRGSGFSPPCPRPRGCCGTGGYSTRTPRSWVGHGPVKRGRLDPRPGETARPPSPQPQHTCPEGGAGELPARPAGVLAAGAGEPAASPENSPRTFPPPLP